MNKPHKDHTETEKLLDTARTAVNSKERASALLSRLYLGNASLEDQRNAMALLGEAMPVMVQIGLPEELQDHLKHQALHYLEEVIDLCKKALN